MFLVRGLDRAATILIVSELVTGEVLRVSHLIKREFKFPTTSPG